MKGEVNVLKQSEAVLKDQLKQLKGNLFDAQKEAEQQQLVNQRLEAEKDKSEETIQELQDTVTTYKEEVSHYHGKDKKDIEVEKNKLEDIVATLEAKAVQYQATIVSLENDNQRLEAEAVLQQAKIASLGDDNQDLRAQVAQYQALFWTVGIPVLSLVVGLYYIQGNLSSGRFVSCI